MKYVFLINSFSLKEKTNYLIDNIEKVCKKRKLDYKIEVNSREFSTEDLIKKYKNEECILLPVGGDGTINRVLNAMNIKKNILGFIPYGTGNDFNRMCHECMEEGIHEIDLIKMNDSYFINVVCFGIDADIGNHSDIIHSKWIPKKMRYNMGLIHHFLKYKPRTMKVTVDGNIIEGRFTTVAVCNARYYGGGYKIAPSSSLTDGLLDIYLVKETTKWDMMRLISGIKHALHEKSDKTTKIRSREVIIESDQIIESNMDGELKANTRFEISLIEKGIKIYYDKELMDDILKGGRK